MTTVANIIAIGAFRPRAEGFILADMTNAVGLAQSAVSLYFFDMLRKGEIVTLSDHVTLAVFFVRYVAVNLALPLAARS